MYYVFCHDKWYVRFHTLVWFKGVSAYNHPALTSNMASVSLADFEFSSHRFWLARKLNVLHSGYPIHLERHKASGVDSNLSRTYPVSLFPRVYSENFASIFEHSGSLKISAEHIWVVTNTITTRRRNLEI